MDKELFQDIDRTKHLSRSRLPRQPKPIPPRIDTDHGSEEYQRLIEAKEASHRRIAGILAARESAKAIQKQINALRSERAKIKGKSKASKELRSQYDKAISDLRLEKDAT